MKKQKLFWPNESPPVRTMGNKHELGNVANQPSLADSAGVLAGPGGLKRSASLRGFGALRSRIFTVCSNCLSSFSESIVVRTPYFPTKPLKLDYIYFHVGRLTTWWSGAEDAVDVCLEMMSKIIEDPLYQRPRSTKRRVTAFKSFLKTVPFDPPHLSRGESLIARFSKVARHRHKIIHGVVSYGTWEGKTWKKQGGWVRFASFSLDDGALDFTDFELAEIEEISDEALSICCDFWDWIAEDLGCSAPHETNKFIDKLRSRLA
ncbi:hypothetical protein LB518_01665 [Mesorhizobium sp. BR1-1-16]|uniref:hypothetical protein n=1 Tax=Mesorhizobium sp. BR1-1-16 TaxID=2876653 RepID=UPI001CCF795B|nr:hypothetical protein [Mesorhizobium sp. BR1-1-16]MBZ9934986.1 hypothetical protein [Mesorhizobium sp. BR1-1-16]